MLQQSSVIFLFFLCCILGYSLVVPFLSKDKSKIWSPITIIALTFIYYIIKPSFEQISKYGADNAPNQYLFYFSAVIFFCSIQLAFRKTQSIHTLKWNYYFSNENTLRIAIILFGVAIICYIPFRGFRTSISSSDSGDLAERTGMVSYFIDLISLFVGSCCLMFINLIDNKGKGIKRFIVGFVLLYFTLVFYIVGGFRYRIVNLILALSTIYHLYPLPKKMNFFVLIPVAVISFLGFAIMDKSRSYGRGIDLEVAKDISLHDAAKGASESENVCCFSIAVIDNYSRSGDYIGFEPILTAILMPIPRAIFPAKPTGEYLRNSQNRVIGDDRQGAAFLVFVEAYMALGILGVVLYGLFIGWLSKKIWSNYQNNKDSIGSILLLALFNGFLYTWMSRGYMAAVFTQFIYYVVLPFWITALVSKIPLKKLSK